MPRQTTLATTATAATLPRLKAFLSCRRSSSSWPSTLHVDVEDGIGVLGHNPSGIAGVVPHAGDPKRDHLLEGVLSGFELHYSSLVVTLHVLFSHDSSCVHPSYVTQFSLNSHSESH